MYLSDKRPINLFGLSPTPFPRPEALRRQAPICWFTGDMAAADSEDFLFQATTPGNEARRNRGNRGR